MFSNNIGMRDLFQNPEMASIFPQFGPEDKLQNVYSFEWVNKKVKEYLISALGAKEEGGGLIVQGKKTNVVREVKSIKWTIESFFNNLPSIVKNVRRNTKVYTPFTNINQLKKINTAEQKLAMLNIILDNLNYNPDLKSLGSIPVYGTNMSFYERQSLWIKRVGYRRDVWGK